LVLLASKADQEEASVTTKKAAEFPHGKKNICSLLVERKSENLHPLLTWPP
jgi:hypothetical protein